MITFTHNNNVVFYTNNKGLSPVLEYINVLKEDQSKQGKVRLNKIYDYIQALQVYGTDKLSINYVKHLDGPIWEIRPKRDRILFAKTNENKYILLHCFYKTTQKTPRNEIEKAYKELRYYKERTIYEKETKI